MKDIHFLKRGMLFGVGFSFSMIFTLFLGFVTAGEIEKYQDGQILDADGLNLRFKTLQDTDTALGLRMVPVGAIIAWHKNINSGDPLTLPDNWVECIGGTVTDTDSPIAGQDIPDLNSPYQGYHAAGVFLRGATGSGGYINDSFQDHRHYRNTYNRKEHDFSDIFEIMNIGGNWDLPLGPYHPLLHVTTGDTSPGYRAATETRPVSFQIVWIMRVK